MTLLPFLFTAGDEAQKNELTSPGTQSGTCQELGFELSISSRLTLALCGANLLPVLDSPVSEGVRPPWASPCSRVERRRPCKTQR